MQSVHGRRRNGHNATSRLRRGSAGDLSIDNPLAAVVRRMLQSDEADTCRIPILVRMTPEDPRSQEEDNRHHEHDDCQLVSSPWPEASGRWPRIGAPSS